MEPIPLETLLKWREVDWIPLWQIAVELGLEDGANPDEVADAVIASIEEPLRTGLLRAGHVYTGKNEPFDPITLPVDDLLVSVREALTHLIDFDEIDIWFNPTPEGEAFVRDQEARPTADGSADVGG